VVSHSHHSTSLPVRACLAKRYGRSACGGRGGRRSGRVPAAAAGGEPRPAAGGVLQHQLPQCRDAGPAGRHQRLRQRLRHRRRPHPPPFPRLLRQRLRRVGAADVAQQHGGARRGAEQPQPPWLPGDRRRQGRRRAELRAHGVLRRHRRVRRPRQRQPHRRRLLPGPLRPPRRQRLRRPGRHRQPPPAHLHRRPARRQLRQQVAHRRGDGRPLRRPHRRPLLLLLLPRPHLEQHHPHRTYIDRSPATATATSRPLTISPLTYGSHGGGRCVRSCAGGHGAEPGVRGAAEGAVPVERVGDGDDGDRREHAGDAGQQLLQAAAAQPGALLLRQPAAGERDAGRVGEQLRGERDAVEGEVRRRHGQDGEHRGAHRQPGRGQAQLQRRQQPVILLRRRDGDVVPLLLRIHHVRRRGRVELIDDDVQPVWC
ncbi:Os01g0327000, partial [Oryza sativa Japonica Group]